METWVKQSGARLDYQESVQVFHSGPKTGAFGWVRGMSPVAWRHFDPGTEEYCVKVANRTITIFSVYEQGSLTVSLGLDEIQWEDPPSDKRGYLNSTDASRPTSVVVAWGDGTYNTYMLPVLSEPTHTYATAGEKTVQVSANFPDRDGVVRLEQGPWSTCKVTVTE